MTIEISQKDGEIFVAMKGYLDTLAAQEVEQQVVEIEAMADKPVNIDVNELEYISSSGLRLLVRIRKAAAAHGMPVKLTGARENVMEVLRITHFDRIFNIH